VWEILPEIYIPASIALQVIGAGNINVVALEENLETHSRENVII
jgi:hypothetical protein